MAGLGKSSVPVLDGVTLANAMDRYYDTWKSLSDVFGELEANKILPKTHQG
jgi:hypothetical protein